MIQQDKDNPLFYVGQKVIAINAIQGSHIKNGDLYWKPDAKKAKHRGLKYKSYDIVVYFSSGDKCDFIINSQRFDHWNKDQVSHFVCKRNKSLNEFEIKPTKIGKYNDSLGGGWYQKVDLYQVDDKFFAMMDCTC